MLHRLAFVAVLTAVLGASPAAWGQQPRGLIYDFTAVWCAPCQQMAPLVESLQRQGIPIQKIDIDRQKDLADRFRITSIPTFVLVVDGQEVERRNGAMTEADLRRMAARIPAPAAPAAAASGTKTESGGPMAIPVVLGEPAAWSAPPQPQVEPQRLAQADEPGRSPKADPEDKGRGFWPFRKKPEPAASVIRATDAELAPVPNPGPLPDEAPLANSVIDPMNASVRIRVIINGGINLGSGTVIHCDGETALVLTCGHIFRNFNDDAKIEVDLFQGGPARLTIARLVKYNDEADLGLIAVPVSSEIAQIRVAGIDGLPRSGEPVASIGCNGGNDPSRQQLRVTAIDKYDGPSNIECTGIPVQGRSGGGLFNRQGDIVGVCVAADKKGQRGLYAGLSAIHALLDECSLSSLYPRPKDAVAATPPPASADEFANPPTVSPPSSPPPAIPAAPIDVETGGAEVIVIVKDQTQGGRQRVVILHQASPKFMNYLNGELDGESRATAAVPQHPSEMPEVHRELRSLAESAAAYTQNERFAPTAFSQPVVPRRFTRAR